MTLIFLPFHTVHGLLNARIMQWFAIPFSSVPHLAELSTMTLVSWVALHCMTHMFIQLDKEFYKLFIKSFIVFYYTFKFVVHFEFIFIRDMCSVSRFLFFSFMCIFNILAPFVEKLICISLYYFCDQLTVFVWIYFWALCSIHLFVCSFINTMMS